MAMFSRLLDGTTLTVKSPDYKIVWELQGGRHVEMWFEGDAQTYRQYTEAELARQLSGLFTTMWAAHRKAQQKVLSELTDHAVRGQGPTDDRRSREFVEEQAKVQTLGRSKTGDLEISAVGMATWTVRIRQDALRMDQDSFLQDVWSAFVAHMTDYRRKMAILKDELFDTGIDKYERRRAAVRGERPAGDHVG